MKKILIFAAAMVLLAGLPFAQTLSNGTKVATVAGGVRWSQCAFGPDGILHVCYEEDTNRGHPVWYVKYDGTTASTPFNVTDSMDRIGSRPTIAVSSKGYIVVTWGEVSGTSVYCRIYNPKTKVWDAIETVSVGYGSDEPYAAIEGDGTIHIYYYSDGGGRSYVSSKINGAWENPVKVSSGYGKQGAVGVGPNGTAWVAWREKLGSNYKNYYSKRPKGGNWEAAVNVTTSGGSSSHPNLAVGSDNVAVLVWGDIDPLNETGCEVRLWRLGVDKTREIIVPFAMQHYPRVAVDVNNKIHVAVQAGGGDYGNGCFYTHNVTGSWVPAQSILSSMDKLPGISADPYGNVAVCMSTYTSGGGSEIYVWSLQKIQSRIIYPPLNLTAAVKIKSLRKVSEATYNLTWAANPANTEAWISGYNIYIKEGDGAYQLLLTVDKSTLSASLTFTDLSKKRRFAIATTNPGGGESDLVEF
jgi:hypothetical protein